MKKAGQGVRIAVCLSALIVAAAALPPAGIAAPAEAGAGRLLVYCAVGVREPVQELAAAFERERGVKMELSFANSGQLLGQIETTRAGDVYIPGDSLFIGKARAKGLAAAVSEDLCYFVPAIYVRKGNPKGIRGLEDLARPGLRLALVDESAALGQVQAALFRTNRLDVAALRRNTATSPATAMDVVLSVKLGTVDAAIVWDAHGALYPGEAEVVRIPPARNVIGSVSACTLTFSRNPGAARAFLDCLASPAAKRVFAAKRFSVERPKREEAGAAHAGGVGAK